MKRSKKTLKSMKSIIAKVGLALMLLAVPAVAMAQSTYEPSEERSDFLSRKKSIMSGNRLLSTYVNTGHAGKWDGNNVDERMFEFPKNTDRKYMYFMSVIVGAEVRDQSTPDSDPDYFAITNAAEGKQSRSGQSWTVNPITGYAREDSDEIARSDRGPGSALGNTWPDAWPDKLAGGGDGWAGSWNGYFGRDQFNADLEFYYKAGDDSYTRYNDETRTSSVYFPDETDPTRGGLGIIMDARVMAWSQTLVNATHFNIFEIKNDASYDYDKVAFGIWIADLVAENAANDQPEFDILRSIAYLTDLDRNLPPANVDFDGPIGEMGLQFLETPGNSVDGIDNDGDSDTYNGLPGVESRYYNSNNQNLYQHLVEDYGGFYSQEVLLDTLLPVFEDASFDYRDIQPGDKMVVIDENYNRIIKEYVPGETIVSRGQSIVLPEGGIVRIEDQLDEADADFGVHIDQIDNDFDGLIDENKPNHLEKTTFFNNVQQQRPVRYINYLYFNVGDTIQPGLIVPNRIIRERMQNDSNFADLVAQNDGRFINIYTAAPMIDEARDDFFDNDQDWLSISDDVGIEGDPDSPSAGAADGMPSSGAGTTFPGEPNIDKTDVSESDMIGVSTATIFAAGQLNTELDADIWASFLLPGEYDAEAVPGEDSDIFVSSSLFPLRRGASERFAVAVTAAQTKQTAADDRRKINSNLQEAQNAYEADYQFATAPLPPKVKAIPGDGYVLLYWDDLAEESFDRYLNRITGNGYDFEGYKVYRTTDDYFELDITDSYGNGQFTQPIAQFDKVDGIQGLHPVAVNGTQYNLGSDTGIRRVFKDSTVTNGKKYFYAVTSYDYGDVTAGIAPSESPVQLSRNPDGSYIMGENVVEVRPAPSAAGYVDPKSPIIAPTQGTPTGDVRVDIVDPYKLIANKTYRIVFEDTLIVSNDPSKPDTTKTKNFSLLDISNGVDTLLARETGFENQDIPEIDGFKLYLDNEDDFGVDLNKTEWVSVDGNDIHDFQVTTATSKAKINDYYIIFGERGIGQSSDITIERAPGQFRSYPSIETNFKIYSPYEDKDVAFALYSPPRINTNGSEPIPMPEVGDFSAFINGSIFGTGTKFSDNIYIIEDYGTEEAVSTYKIRMDYDTEKRNPIAGDTLKIFTSKPFTANDVYEFKFNQDDLPRVDNELAKDQLDMVKVVPNPYIVSSIYEPKLTSDNRTQRRELHFTHLPVPCKLRIFSVSGQLIRELDIEEGDSRVHNGTYIWNMLTRDNLEISYGVYVYQIDAPGVGKKTGKFAVIK